MNLERRVEHLEHKLGTERDFLLIIIRAIGSDPERVGPSRAIEREPVGYSSAGRQREWHKRPGESIQELKGRMEAELRAEGHKAYVVCERYEAPLNRASVGDCS